VDILQYQGWKNNLRLRNGVVELLATLDVGPRIISYRLDGGPNVLKEYPDQLGKSGEPDWQIRGGHRLWASPEDPARTYAPDNAPVACRELPSGWFRLTQSDKQYGLQKEIDLRLAEHGSGVALVHRITNVGDQPTTLAPWALTVMAPGGVEIIPLPPRKPHPGLPTNALSPRDYATDRVLVLWPFFDFTDPRWTFGSRYITLRHDSRRGPTKIGLAHRLGWAAYFNSGNLFVKRFTYQEGQQYPDGGCNLETFSNEDMLEVESLGPVTTLAPGQAVELEESWQLFGGVEDVRDEAAIDRTVLPKVQDTSVP
jgi:hypothetical protein